MYIIWRGLAKPVQIKGKIYSALRFLISNDNIRVTQPRFNAPLRIMHVMATMTHFGLT